jgi:putative transposase
MAFNLSSNKSTQIYQPYYLIFKVYHMDIKYHNLYTHFILTTINRLPLITENHRDRIEKYMTGIVNNLDSRMYAIFANPEHVHMLISRSPRISEQEIATIIADSTQRFINDNNMCKGKFAWQDSAAAFSVSRSDIDRLCKYILNQAEHHRKVSFQEEYKELWITIKKR